MKKRLSILFFIILSIPILYFYCFNNKTTESEAKDYSISNSLNMTLCKEINVDSNTTISINKDENNLFHTLILKKSILKGWNVEFSTEGVDIDRDVIKVLDNKENPALLTIDSFRFSSQNKKDNINMKCGFFRNPDYKEIHINDTACKIVKLNDDTFFYYILNTDINDTDCNLKVIAR